MHQQRSTSDADLDRTLGFREALTIGTGTMVGAGIFVFPGLAAGEAGPAAMLSFAIGSGIALLVALPASELATAMPRSGGGYYYVSRGLGALAGCAVGIGQWFGLVFASAFYLVGFGHYLEGLLEEFGVATGGLAVPMALAFAAILTIVGLVGAEKSGALQNSLVGVLVLVLVCFLAYGIADAVGLIGETQLPTPFAPFGVTPVFTTAALVFTSYLGFVQIATVAGEIKQPERNLPRAMVGSVMFVGLLYVLMMFVSTSLVESEELASFGETAAVEVGRRLLGTAGALVILGCGLLATLSSANASILSASRSVYALSKDAVLPKGTAAVSDRFGTPYVALLLAGAPILLLIVLGRTELLAEVASVLHLVMYGLICFTLVRLRRQAPSWYRPTYRVPASPLLPILGGVASFALIGFMSPLSIGLGAAVIAAAGGWYAAYGHRASNEPEVHEPPPVEPLRVPGQVLVPVRLPDPEALSPLLVNLLASLDVVVLGVYPVPKHTAVEQARNEFESAAREALEATAAAFEQQEGTVQTRLVFTADARDAISRIATEERTDAVLIPGPAEAMQRLLLPVRDTRNARRIARFAAALLDCSQAELTLLHVKEEDDEENVLDPIKALIAEHAEAEGERLHLDVAEADDPMAYIVETARGYDLVVVGETEPSIAERVLGDLPGRVARKVGVPVLVVQYLEEGDDADATPGAA